MHGKGDWRLFHGNAVMAVRHMAGMHRRHEILMRGGDGRRGRRSRCIGLNRRHLRLRRRTWVEVVRDRRPSLTNTCGIHARDHCHDF